MHPVRLAARCAAAALLLTTAAIHAYLYVAGGYDQIPTIGPLFLLNAGSGAVLGVALLGAPGRWLRPAAAAAALFALGTLAALVISTVHGLFGWQEFTGATLYWPSVAVEAAAAALCLGLTGRRPAAHPAGAPALATRASVLR